MQSAFVIITKLIASKNYFCKEVFCNDFGRDGNRSVRLKILLYDSLWGGSGFPVLFLPFSFPVFNLLLEQLHIVLGIPHAISTGNVQT